MQVFIRIILFFSLVLLLDCEGQVAETQTDQSEPGKDSAGTEQTEDPKSEKKTIVFFGNSLSAAYGLSPSQGFVGLIEKRIDSLELPYKVINLGLSGETTAAGKSRIDWVLKQPIDIFVLELGGNDALRGIEPEESYRNLQYILSQVKDKYPQAKLLIAGMEAPPNMGPEYTSAFREMYPKLAKANNAELIPFLLQDVGGIKELNLPDGIHPTADGHKIVAATIWEVLAPML